MSEQPASPSARQVELLEAAYRYALEHGLADLSLRPLAAAIGSSPRVLMFLFGNKDGLVKALLARAREDELAVLDGLTGPGDHEPGRREPHDHKLRRLEPGDHQPASDHGPGGLKPGGLKADRLNADEPEPGELQPGEPEAGGREVGEPEAGEPEAGEPEAGGREVGGLQPGGLVSAAEQIWVWLREPRHRPLLRLWAEAYSRSLIEPDGAWAGFAASTVRDWLGLLASYQPRPERDTVDGAARRTAVLAVLRGCLLDLLATGDQDRVDAALHSQLDLIRNGR